MTDVVDLGSVGVRLPRAKANGNDAAFDEYAAINAVNFSTLKHMATSALLCRYRADNPEADKDSFRQGRLLHVATLEPERWARQYVIEPDFGEQRTAKGEIATNPKATKGYKEALAAWKASLPPGALVVDPAEHAMAERCARAVRSHRATAELFRRGGRYEHTVRWTDSETGVACKARLDLVESCVVDLKGTHRDSIRRFIADTAEYLYFAQCAWYHDAAVAAGELPSSATLPALIGVQKHEPHDVIPLRMTRETYEVGQGMYRSLLRRYVECQDAGWWPGLAQDFVDWTLPSYALGAPGRFEEDAEW